MKMTRKLLTVLVLFGALYWLTASDDLTSVYAMPCCSDCDLARTECYDGCDVCTDSNCLSSCRQFCAQTYNNCLSPCDMECEQGPAGGGYCIIYWEYQGPNVICYSAICWPGNGSYTWPTPWPTTPGVCGNP
jgi:hypothetical protein